MLKFRTTMTENFFSRNFLAVIIRELFLMYIFVSRKSKDWDVFLPPLILKNTYIYTLLLLQNYTKNVTKMQIISRFAYQLCDI